MILNRAGMTRIVMVSACMFFSESIVYENGKQACRGSLNGPFRIVLSRGVKSSQVLTPQSCKEQGARIKKGGGMPRIILRSRPVPLDGAPVGQCAGSTRLLLSEVPDVVLRLCAQGEGAILRIAP